jgi:hypothetical protein
MKQQLAFVEWMIKFDKTIFNTEDEVLKNARCSCKQILADPNYTPPNNVVTCIWKELEFCSDEDLQISW